MEPKRIKRPNLRRARTSRGDSCANVAGALQQLAVRHGIRKEVGVDGPMVHDWETGRSNPGYLYVWLLCLHYDKSDADLNLADCWHWPVDPRHARLSLVDSPPPDGPQADGIAATDDDVIHLPIPTPEGIVMYSISRRAFLASLAGAVPAVAAPFAQTVLDPASTRHLSQSIVDLAAIDSVDPIDHLRQLRSMLVESDNLLGPRQIIPTVERYIRIIQELRETCSAADSRALLQMKAQYAELAGWLYHDAGDFVASQHWTDRALEWAHSVNDIEMAVYVLARKSQLAGDMRDSASAIDLAAAAANLAPPRSRLAAIAPTYAAFGHALNGRPLDCFRALDSAAALVTSMDDNPDTQWAPWLDLAYIDVQRARCLTILGNAGQAASIFQQAIHSLPTSYHRDRGVYLAREAVAHAADHDPEQAASIGLRALAIAQRTNSRRIVAELTQVASSLRQWSAIKAVNDFLEAQQHSFPTLKPS